MADRRPPTADRRPPTADRYNDAATMLDYGFGTSTASTMQLRKLPTGAQQD